MRSLRRLFPVVGSALVAVAVVAAAAFVVGSRRHSDDVSWCRKVMPTVISIQGGLQPVQAQELERYRGGCVAMRRSQRGVLGAVWKRGGERMAECGVDWARFQQLAQYDRPDADAVVTPYGIHDPLSPTGIGDQDRFVKACLAIGPRLAGGRTP